MDLKYLMRRDIKDFRVRATINMGMAWKLFLETVGIEKDEYAFSSNQTNELACYPLSRL